MRTCHETKLQVFLLHSQLHYILALNINCWIIDSGAIDHMTNKALNFHDFQTLPKPSHGLVANGQNALVLGVGKINLLSNSTKSNALLVRTFPFQFLSIRKITRTLNCLVIFFTKQCCPSGFSNQEDNW